MPVDEGQEAEVVSTDDAATNGDLPAGAAQPAHADDDREQRSGRIPLDLVGGFVVLAISALFILGAGDGTLDWIFPLSLGYTLALIGAIVTIRGLVGFGDKTTTLLPVLHGKGVDVLVFTLMTVVYVVLAPLLGFWLMSAAMIFGAAVYLDHARSRKRIALAAVVSVAVCIAAYILLLRVFYVPLPRARLLPF
jgi:hypothetical protein